MSVTISSYAVRKNQKNEEFIALILSGAPELIKSVKTGKFYATQRSCSIPSTMNEEMAKQSIGIKMPGSIVRVPSEEYEYTTSSNEKVILDFTYEYQDTNQHIEEKLFN